MSENEARLLRLLQERAVQRGGPFRLASGQISDYYLDVRQVSVYSAGAWLIGEVLYERTWQRSLAAVGGLATGAIPLVTALVASYHRHGRELEGFWVRSEIKDHGLQRRVEGRLRPGMPVAIVEDVLTSGQSALQAVQAVREQGGQVVLVLALVDRQAGGVAALEAAGVPEVQTLFRLHDFGLTAS